MMAHDPDPYRDPHAEGLMMMAFVLCCAALILVFAVIGMWTVLGWVFGW